MSVLGLAGLGAFGAVVVKAQEDAGVLAFIRQQTRPIAEARPSIPRLRPEGAVRPASAERCHRLCPGMPPSPSAQVRLTPPDPRTVQPFIPSDQPPTAQRQRSSDASRTGQGHRCRLLRADLRRLLFPLGVSTGLPPATRLPASLCPDLGDARLHAPDRRRHGCGALCATRQALCRPAAAFTHRNSYKATCSCTGKGFGLATGYSARYDQTLRVGDAVMTAKGMMIFNGGAKVPYRDASFTTLNAATSSTAARASPAPARAGLAPAPVRLRAGGSRRTRRRQADRLRQHCQRRRLSSATWRRHQPALRSRRASCAALSRKTTDWSPYFRNLLNICFHCVFY